MALTFDALQAIMKVEGIRYFVDPNQPVVLFTMGGPHGTFQITISVQDDGRFLQMRTYGLLECPATHPNLAVVLRALASANCNRRFVKLGWDQNDGEIMAYGDLWVVDGTVTQEQFSRMVGNFFSTVDLEYERLRQTRDTGRDPGPISFTPSPEGPAGSGGEVSKI